MGQRPAEPPATQGCLPIDNPVLLERHPCVALAFRGLGNPALSLTLDGVCVHAQCDFGG